MRKNGVGISLIVALSIIPIVIWVLDGDISNKFGDFSSNITSLGQVAGLLGLSWFAIAQILGGRLKIFERMFLGMNQVYVVHHFMGGIALMALLVHPLAVSAAYLPISINRAVQMLMPTSNWQVNLGITALLLLMSLLVLTFFVKLPYELWRLSHKFLGAVLFIGGLHALFIPSTISNNLILAVYMDILVGTALVVYLYRTVLGRFTVYRYRYKVVGMQKLSDNVVDFVMEPTTRPMAFLPGQFAFVEFVSPGLTSEVHPFSMSCQPDSGTVRITAKVLGDYTKKLETVTVGAKVIVEGPYGAFLYKAATNKSQIWIAGGIGVTPFLSMARSLYSNAVEYKLAILTPTKKI